MLIVLKVELIKDILGLQVVVKDWLKQQNTHKGNTHLLKLITIRSLFGNIITKTILQ
jgi:hypothetical protein